MNPSPPVRAYGSRPLIHIGYTKAGSTWLQEFLFEDANAGFALIDRPASVEQIIIPHALDFDPDRAFRHLRPSFEKAVAAGLVPVVSAERLSGSPHSGGYDITEMADRLHRMYPGGRILVTIREQRAIVASTYKQYVRVGGTCRPMQYFVPPTDPRVPLFDLDYFAYHRLIEYYFRRFGRDAVLVQAFEQFIRSGDEFVAAICTFAGVPPVAGLPYHVTLKGASSPFVRSTTRWRNMVSEPTSINVRTRRMATARRALTALGRLDPVVPGRAQARLEGRLANQVRELVGDRYRESNRITAGLTGIDLGALGYDV